MAMFKQLHPENLNQLKSLLQLKSPVWFHADGNMYIGERESDNHKLYTNFNPEGTNHPSNVGARYRYKFTAPGQVPDSLDAMEKMFIENKQAEDVFAAEPVSRKENFVFKTEAPAPVGKTVSVEDTDTGAVDTASGKKAKKDSEAAKKAAELAALTGGGAPPQV
jgi:hypothetical protein